MWEIFALFAPLSEEKIVHKTGAGTFENTDLQENRRSLFSLMKTKKQYR